jgi:hypothetical protein
MDILLRHPGWIGQTLIAAMIVFQAFLTLAALRFYLPAGLYAVVAVGSAALLWLAGSALKAALSGADFEGYVLLIALALIALALIAQAVLSGVTLPRMRATRKNA